MKASLSEWLARAGLVLLVLSLCLPWFDLIYLPTGEVKSTLNSPLGAFLGYQSQCANAPSLFICLGDVIAGFAMLQLPIFLGVYWAVISVWHHPRYLMVSLAGMASVGIWGFFGLVAIGEPIWESRADVGLYLTTVGSFLFLAAEASKRWATSKAIQANPK
jgi:hypothetical protein